MNRRSVPAAVFAAAVLLCLLLFGGCGSTEAAPTVTPEPTPCLHEVWENGICAQCGMVCEHSSFTEEGVCESCGFLCPHTAHSAEDARCLLCGRRMLHTYDGNDLCVCGRTAPAADGYLDPALFEECPEQGSLVTLLYPTPNYLSGDEEEIKKPLYAYLPYGYDYNAEQRYNVLILMHGSAGDEDYWLMSSQDYDSSHEIYVPNLLDWLIYLGEIEPCIVITPTYRNPGTWWDGGVGSDSYQFGSELRSSLLPFIVENFRTWAEDGSEAGLVAAREHFAIAGASYGSMIAYNAGWYRNFDLFAWYGALSGSGISGGDLAAAMERSGLPLGFLYACAGDNDSELTTSRATYDALLSEVPSLKDGEDCVFELVPDASHDIRVWENGLVRALLHFFR